MPNKPTKLNTLDSHYKDVIEAIKQGVIIPILSADINLCGRPEKPNGEPVDWQDGNYPPSGYELAIHLAKIEGCEYVITCPLCNTTENHLPPECPIHNKDAITKLALANVSQYLALCAPTTLDSTLRKIIKAEYLPNPVHKFLAKLPKFLKDNNYAHPYPLIVTTCLDSSLEQAFQQANQNFDVVAFIGNETGGKFQHTIFEDGSLAESIAIDTPETYDKVSLEKRPVILKLYGGVEIGAGKKFTISEDHFIDYLTQRSIDQLLPPNLLSVLKEKGRHILFLEYSPSHWNLRLILHRIWREQLDKKDKQWWSVQEHPEGLDDKFWDKYGVINSVVDSLEAYISELEKRLEAELPAEKKLISTTSEEDANATETLQRSGVFISYSHKDKEWLDKFKEMYGIIDENALWDDSKIQTGMKWADEIKKALASAKVAVLLVSQNFLNSNFIAKDELPPLLEAAEKQGLIIFWICLTSCGYKRTQIGKRIVQYQAAHDVSQPLDKLSDADQNEVLNKICEELYNLINPEDK